MSVEYEHPECDFHHHLYDTVILLGGRKDIADLVKKCMDGVTPKDIDALRNYNIELMTAAKLAISSVNKISITPQ